MIKDLLISFKDNLKTKSTNPLLGTLVLVWFTKNWNLFYTLLNFDPNTTLIQKKEFVINHFTTRPLIETLSWCVLEAFIVLIISYFLINLSRLIVNFYEKRLTPLVYKWTDEKSIVLKSVYEISENERKRLEKRVEEERDAKLKLQEDYDKLEKRVTELLMQKNESKSIEKNVSTNIKKPLKLPNHDNDKLNLIINKLKKDNKIGDFKKIASDILNNNPIRKSNNLISEIMTMGLITQGIHASTPDWYKYTLTAMGQEMHEKLLLEELK